MKLFFGGKNEVAGVGRLTYAPQKVAWLDPCISLGFLGPVGVSNLTTLDSHTSTAVHHNRYAFESSDV